MGKGLESVRGWVEKNPRTAERVFVVVMLLVFFLLALPDIFIPIRRDEAVILDLASHFPRYYPDVDKLPEGTVEGFYDVPFWYHPPTTTLLMIPFRDIRLAKLATLLFSGATLLFAYMFTKRRFGIRIATGFLLMVCFNPDLIRVASFVWNDEYMFFFLFLGLLAYEYGLEKLSLLTNVFAGNCKISYPFLSLIYFGKNWRTGIKVIIVTALGLMPYWLWSWASTGEPLYVLQTWLTISRWSGGAYRLSLFPFFKKWYLYLLGLAVLGLFTKKIDFKKSKDMVILFLASFLVYNNASWSLIGGIISLSILFSVLVNSVPLRLRLLLTGLYIVLITPQLLNALPF